MRLLTLAIVLLFPFSAFAAGEYYVANGATATIDELGTCKKVTNNSGAEIFVPTATANEWYTGGNSFIEHPPAGVMLSDCSAPSNRFTLSGAAGPATAYPGEPAYSYIAGAASNGACMIQASDSSLWCWGPNTNGKLGDGTTTAATTPVAVSGGGQWLMVSLGSSHSCGIKTDHTLWCWGRNGAGELGNNSTTDSHVPVQIPGSWSSVATAAGGSYNYHTCGIKTDGTGWCWGYNFYGELGIGSTSDKHVPTAISGGGTWTDIVVGDVGSCGIKTGGAGYCWGRHNSNSSNTTSPGSIGSGWTKLAAYYTNVCGLKGTAVSCWTQDGGSTSYQSYSISGAYTDVTIGSGWNYALTSDGTVYSFSKNNTSPALIPGIHATDIAGALSFLGSQP